MNQPQADTGSSGIKNLATDELRARLIHYAETCSDLNAHHLSRLCSKLIDLTTLVDQFDETAIEVDFAYDMKHFCAETYGFLEQALNSDSDSAAEAEQRLQHLTLNWGQYLDLLPETERYSDKQGHHWEQDQGSNWNSDDHHIASEEEQLFEAGDMGDILAQLEGLQNAIIEQNSQNTDSSNDAALTIPTPEQKPVDFSELNEESINDPEMVSAYVDDAQQCLAGMESCLLELENDQNNVQSLQQFCRELHTLKGASGTVGLLKLSRYLHDLETDVEEMSRGGKLVDVDPLLNAVDFVRQQVSKFAPPGAGEAPLPEPARAAQQTIEKPTREATGETYVRLEASRLDRLMDLLAELVMLRNRRETYVHSLEGLLREINTCSSRLRQIDVYPQDYQLSTDRTEDDGEYQQIHNVQVARKLTTKINELSKDVAELGLSLHETVDPLARDNSTITHLIGNFRSELMELRRQPITGLFRRLHSVARDAGKAENRQVELTLIGQGTRVERSLQERLYEPLMHLIRNSVSHGIESSDERVKAGKSPVGQITLEAWTDATSVYLEIRDDGRGLDESVLEKKGLELGLIRPGTKLSREKIWELILQPGFSTKSEVSQISGRGVGMDVVASQIRSMRGKVTIDSVVGKQTSFRLEIPLNSTIEHAMIVRCGEQLFALPMHAIFGTQTNDQISEEQNIVGLHELLEIPSEHTSTQRVITLRQQESRSQNQAVAERTSENLSIVVDAVVGVEEVVVRALPSLLQHHRCFSGVTLSGEAQTVLVLDVPRLSEFASQLMAENDEFVVPRPPEQGEEIGQEIPKSLRGLNVGSQRILVVDDSISVRRNIIRKLEVHGFEIVEAADGVQALEKLRNGQYTAVVTDIDMPRMNGLDFVAELRRVEKGESIPVVVLTSRTDEESIQTMNDLGVRRVFTKPINDSMMKSLLHAIRFRPRSLEPTPN